MIQLFMAEPCCQRPIAGQPFAFCVSNYHGIVDGRCQWCGLDLAKMTDMYEIVRASSPTSEPREKDGI